MKNVRHYNAQQQQHKVTVNNSSSVKIVTGALEVNDHRICPKKLQIWTQLGVLTDTILHIT